jgi:hypothetical protein
MATDWLPKQVQAGLRMAPPISLGRVESNSLSSRRSPVRLPSGASLSVQAVEPSGSTGEIQAGGQYSAPRSDEVSESQEKADFDSPRSPQHLSLRGGLNVLGSPKLVPLAGPAFQQRATPGAERGIVGRPSHIWGLSGVRRGRRCAEQLSTQGRGDAYCLAPGGRKRRRRLLDRRHQLEVRPSPGCRARNSQAARLTDTRGDAREGSATSASGQGRAAPPRKPYGRARFWLPSSIGRVSCRIHSASTRTAATRRSSVSGRRSR